MSDLSYLMVLPEQHVLGQENQSSEGLEYHHLHGLGQQPTDYNPQHLICQKLNTTTIRVDESQLTPNTMTNSS